MGKMDRLTEQSALRVSIAATVVVALFGILFGLLSGAFSIAFDGFYSLADATMTVLSLIVSELIVRSARTNALSGKLRDRFTMGFWHLEPIVLGLNGLLLMVVAIYALINAVITLLDGGNVLKFDLAILYAVVTLAVCLAMAWFGHRVNLRLKSEFLKLDVRAWIMSGCITGALLVAFILGWAVQGTRLEWLSPYVDPAVLALVCLVIIPLPLGTVRQALSDVLLITPPDLKVHVDSVAEEMVAKYGFKGYRAYAARVGRGTQVELYFILRTGLPPEPLEHWDRLRDEIGDAIGGEGPDRWLTIAFTTDPGWAE
ncbi:cation transporter [Haematobacter massiliensis]|nr:cation transporter [Haematobacter massiliensis]OWJ88690.1 cation transporter [Haematobacter massiliensis]QBJ23179.1 cation transporter [Haematobacter massiliensis]